MLSLRLSAALLAAGRRHELVLLPGAGHRVAPVEVAEHPLRLELDFLRTSLAR